MSIVITTVAETRVKDLESLNMVEARIEMPKPDKISIWYRKRTEADMKTHRDGQTIELTLALNFNPTTLKYTITVN